jgi:hypothetical protein
MVGSHAAPESGNISTMGFLDRLLGCGSGPESRPRQHAPAGEGGADGEAGDAGGGAAGGDFGGDFGGDDVRF